MQIKSLNLEQLISQITFVSSKISSDNCLDKTTTKVNDLHYEHIIDLCNRFDKQSYSGIDSQLIRLIALLEKPFSLIDTIEKTKLQYDATLAIARLYYFGFENTANPNIKFQFAEKVYTARNKLLITSERIKIKKDYIAYQHSLLADLCQFLAEKAKSNEEKIIYAEEWHDHKLKAATIYEQLAYSSIDIRSHTTSYFYDAAQKYNHAALAKGFLADISVLLQDSPDSAAEQIKHKMDELDLTQKAADLFAIDGKNEEQHQMLKNARSLFYFLFKNLEKDEDKTIYAKKLEELATKQVKYYLSLEDKHQIAVNLYSSILALSHLIYNCKKSSNDESDNKKQLLSFGLKGYQAAETLIDLVEKNMQELKFIKGFSSFSETLLSFAHLYECFSEFSEAIALATDDEKQKIVYFQKANDARQRAI